MSDVIVSGIELTALHNRVTALDGVGATVPSKSAMPVVQNDLNGLHTTLNQLTLALQSQLNLIATQITTLQGTVNQLLGGPIVAPTSIAAIPGQSLVSYNSTTGTFTQAPNLIRTAQVVLTSAQILTLGTVPVQIIPAPGAGQMIVPMFATYKLVYNSVRYTVSADNFALTVGTATTTNAFQVDSLFGTVGFLDQAQSAYMAGDIATGVSTLASVTNAPLMLTTVSGTNSASAGNSTVVVTVQYYVQTA
jgi:hypothetical protein